MARISIMARVTSSAKGSPTPRRMGIHGLLLILGHVGDGDALVLEQADPCVEGVHQRRIVMHPGRV